MSWKASTPLTLEAFMQNWLKPIAQISHETCYVVAKIFNSPFFAGTYHDQHVATSVLYGANWFSSQKRGCVFEKGRLIPLLGGAAAGRYQNLPTGMKSPDGEKTTDATAAVEIRDVDRPRHGGLSKPEDIGKWQGLVRRAWSVTCRQGLISKRIALRCTTRLTNGCFQYYLRNLLSASRVGFRISVVNSNATHVGLSSPHPFFHVLVFFRYRCSSPWLLSQTQKQSQSSG